MPQLTVSCLRHCVLTVVLLALVAFVASPTSATAQKTSWNSSLYGSTSDATASASIADSSGNIFVVGSTSTGALVTYKINGQTGDPMWSDAFIGTRGQASGSAITIDTDGNPIMTGQSYDLVGATNMLTIKYNGVTGTRIWTASLDAGSSDLGSAVAVDNNNDVLVTGYSTDLSSGLQAFRTVKYAGGTGAELWKAAFIGDAPRSTNGGRAIAVDNLNNAIVVGYSEDASGNRNIRTIKYAGGSGAQLWTSVFNGTGFGLDYGVAVALDPNGHVIVVGTSVDFSGASNIRTIKYDGAAGMQLWSSAFNGDGGSNSMDSAVALAVDSAGNAFVVGTSTDLSGGANARTIKYDGQSGTQLWTVAVDGAAHSDDLGISLALDQNGDVLVLSTVYESPPVPKFRLTKYLSSNGSTMWSVAGAGASTDLFYASLLNVDQSGNPIVFAAQRIDPIYKQRTLKFDGASGNVIWEKIGTSLAIPTMAFVGGGEPVIGKKSIAVAPDGNLVAAGTAVYPLPGGSSGYELRVIKYDQVSGAQLWDFSYRNLSTEVGYVIAIDAVGDVIVTGVAASAAGSDPSKTRTIKLSGATGGQIWMATRNGTSSGGGGHAIGMDVAGNVFVAGPNGIAKYNGANGAEIWAINGPIVPRAITIDAQGNAIVTGTGNAFRTIKIAGATGDVLWASQYTPSPSGLAVIADSNGDIICTGNSATVKYNGSTGQQIWAFTDPSDDQIWNAVGVDADGNPFVTGYGFRNNSIVLRTHKLSASTGQKLWSSAGQGFFLVAGIGYDLKVSASGDVFVVGYSGDGSDGRNIRAIKYRGSDGFPLWSKGIGARGDDFGYAIATGPQGAIYVGGLSTQFGKPKSWFVQRLDDVPSSSLTLGSSGNPIVPGGQVTFLATVSGTAPTGSIAFLDGDIDISGPIVLSGSSATFSTNTLSQGTHSITAWFSGDANNSASISAPVLQAVLPPDTMPDPFMFTDQANVQPGAVVTSNTITITGLNAPATIAVAGGSYSIGCGGVFSSLPGMITNGQTVCVVHTAPLALAASTNTLVTIGGVSDTFNSTTVANLPPNGDFDNDGIPNGDEGPEGRDLFAKDNDVFASNRLFAMQQYRDFLGREGDAGGITSWVNYLDGGGTRAAVAEGFFGSNEFQGTGSPVVRLYFAYFLRIPDFGGLTFWMNYYRAGHSLVEISNAFAGSQEFLDRYGALTNGEFVDLVYQNVLGRTADASGKAFWLGQLSAGMTRGEMMVGFSESPEYQSTIFGETYVTMMYVGMLKRQPDASGFTFWVSYLDGGNSGQALINGFLAASEYRSRFLP